jgi:hypothetical protein
VSSLMSSEVQIGSMMARWDHRAGHQSGHQGGGVPVLFCMEVGVGGVEPTGSLCRLGGGTRCPQCPSLARKEGGQRRGGSPVC